MPRTLSARIAGGFLVLGAATLLVVCGALFLVLRGLHAEATAAGLADLAGGLLPQVRQSVMQGDLRGTIAEVRAQLDARGIQVMLVEADGTLRALDGTAFGHLAPSFYDPADGSPAVNSGPVVLGDGERYLVAAVQVRPGPGPGRGGRIQAIAMATPDHSAVQAAADLRGAIPLVLLVMLLVGTPMTWLISRSVTRPLARLATASASLPRGGHEPIQPEGPSEVQALTGTFNAMADELANTRRQETELLANLRHDLRTPVTVIAGFAEALADGTATGDDAARAARAIGEEAARLDRLVGELGALERIGSGEVGLRPEQVDPETILEAARERFAPGAESRGVEITVVRGAPLAPGLAADRLALDRILGNLVANATAAAETGGKVWLAATPVTLGPGARPAVAFSVTDDGPGFPPGTAARAFDRFFRGDPSRTGAGSGLGLAIVRELAVAHGGEAHAENVAPRGARVTVVLPVIPTPSSEDSSAAQRP